MIRSIEAGSLQPDMWLIYTDARYNQRVIEVLHGPLDGQVKVYTDFGTGGEPNTKFFDEDEIVRVADAQYG